MLTRFRDKEVDRDWLSSNFPRMMACPAGTNAGRYVALIAEGRFEEAYRYARDPNPMASICRSILRALPRSGIHPGAGFESRQPHGQAAHLYRGAPQICLRRNSVLSES
jgi:hypothetical protein